MYHLKQMFVFSPARIWRLKLAFKFAAVLCLVAVVCAVVFGGISTGLLTLPIALLVLLILPVIASAPGDELENQRMQEAQRQRQKWQQEFAKLDEDMRKLQSLM